MGTHELGRMEEINPITLMHALGADRHWEVLASVAQEPKTVSAIAEELELAMSSITKSLSRLAVYGLVGYEPFKNRRIYFANPSVVKICNGEELKVDLLFSEHDSIRVSMSLADLQGKVTAQVEVKEPKQHALPHRTTPEVLPPPEVKRPPEAKQLLEVGAPEAGSNRGSEEHERPRRASTVAGRPVGHSGGVDHIPTS